MVGVAGKSKGCNTYRQRKVKVGNVLTYANSELNNSSVMRKECHVAHVRKAGKCAQVINEIGISKICHL